MIGWNTEETSNIENLGGNMATIKRKPKYRNLKLKYKIRQAVLWIVLGFMIFRFSFTFGRLMVRGLVLQQQAYEKELNEWNRIRGYERSKLYEQ